MPRFFFHVFNGNGETPDDAGIDLQDQSAARKIALDSIRSMIAEEARQGTIDLNGFIVLKDEPGNVLLTVDFIEAFELRLPSGPEAS
jgi:hypothetical protein